MDVEGTTLQELQTRYDAAEKALYAARTKLCCDRPAVSKSQIVELHVAVDALLMEECTPGDLSVLVEAMAEYHVATRELAWVESGLAAEWAARDQDGASANGAGHA